ncbi:MAG TPA: ABC transporter substrate-binding protein, partial [Anaerovoracaceae bacterium]|nr:ABC transporter substrate-binding protein [Anaerovoracaceae bacterium]
MKCIHKSKFVILILVVILACVGLLSGCGSKDTDTLVIGNGEMNGVFNPFFVETNADQNVVKLTAVTLNRLTENGLLEGYASEYIAPEEILGADGQVDFTKYIYKIKNDVQFSDGTPVTAEDVIFSIKVLCDPSYNGLSTINTLPIVGLEEYIYDTADYNELIAGFENEAKQIDKEYVLEYIKAMASEAVSTYSEEELTAYMGIELDAGLKGRERQTALEKEYYEFEAANAFDYYIEGAQAEKVKQLKDEYISDKAGNFQIQEIEGVKAIDDRTVEITLAGVNPSAVWDIGEVVIAPEHYYGKGFEKGDLASVRSKDGAPLGAGPYVFESYQNNVVTMSANKNYFLGKPNIPKIKFAYTTKANTVDGIALGEIDIADVEATQDEISKIEENKLYYMTTDFQGYGYIGINSNRINDINVRKGLMSLINKEPAVNTYFGGLASVIERPASADSWVYPADSKP